jgi:hypothetical protein
MATAASSPLEKAYERLPQEKELEELISQGKELISQGRRPVSALEEVFLRKMQEKEEPMVLWLTCLARNEVELEYKPTEEESAWVRRIAKFYHTLMPLMRIVLEAKYGKRPPVTVFVSHTGKNKEMYAAPLRNHLTDNGVAEVFIDKRIRIGAKGDDKMMWAAVSCKYFWCVLTKEFVQNEYPMRELLVGYARHIQESGGAFTCSAILLEPLRQESGPAPWLGRTIRR